jgi:hypothetical protein
MNEKKHDHDEHEGDGAAEDTSKKELSIDLLLPRAQNSLHFVGQGFSLGFESKRLARREQRGIISNGVNNIMLRLICLEFLEYSRDIAS